MVNCQLFIDSVPAVAAGHHFLSCAAAVEVCSVVPAQTKIVNKQYVLQCTVKYLNAHLLLNLHQLLPPLLLHLPLQCGVHKLCQGTVTGACKGTGPV